MASLDTGHRRQDDWHGRCSGGPEPKFEPLPLLSRSLRICPCFSLVSCVAFFAGIWLRRVTSSTASRATDYSNFLVTFRCDMSPLPPISVHAEPCSFSPRAHLTHVFSAVRVGDFHRVTRGLGRPQDRLPPSFLRRLSSWMAWEAP